MLQDLLMNDWKEILKDEFDEPYFKQLESTITREIIHHEICPSLENVFRAFNLCSYENTRVVIIGDKPYANSSLSDGLAFSTFPNSRITDALINIFVELSQDLGCYIPNNGSLESWAKQGVLLLNSVLTTNSDRSGSHRAIGWEHFTDAVIKALNQKENSLVFMFWCHNKRKTRLINHQMHLVLKAANPNPFRGGSNFRGCGNFSKCNEYMYEIYPTTIDWQIPSINI